jgi:glycosyltransferase involved in cell wall biosynthesis
MALEVSVVIPARDEAETIGRCLGALARQSIGARALEVIVVAAGADGTAAIAERAAAGAGFDRFAVERLDEGNKNAALQMGCARVTAPIVVLLDADTELAPDAIAELACAVRGGPERVVHGAATPRFDTWISRYWELNRKFRKDLRFDGTLSGEVVALRRSTLATRDLAALFPSEIGAKDDLYFGRVLAAGGCDIGYVQAARATTLVPWTFGVLIATMRRSRRDMMRLASIGDATRQAALSVALVGGLPAAIVTARLSLAIAAACIAPLTVYACVLTRRVAALRRLGLGDHRRELPSFLLLDLLGRAIKVWSFVGRLAGSEAPRSFRGGRPGEVRG